MYHSKLIDLYTCLTNPEKAQFKKWVKSPMHNQHEDVVQLFDFIASKRAITERTISKIAAFDFIYPQKKYDDLRLRHVMSLGVEVLEKFVCFLMQNREDFFLEKNLISFYRMRNFGKYAQKQLEKTKLKQSQVKIKDSQHYYRQYELEQASFEQAGSEERMRTTNLQDVCNTYAIAFVIETLRNACTALTYQNLNKQQEYHIPFLDAILTEIKKGSYGDIVAVQFYYNSYLSLTQPDEPAFFHQLKKLLLQHSDVLPTTEIKNIHVITLNFCIKKLNTGAEEYVQEVFDLFKYGLEQNILINDNILSRFTYKNIVTAALRLNEIEWTANFINLYTPYLESKYKKNYHHFADAKLLFAKGDYAQTMNLLHQVEYDDLFLNLDAKMLLVKIYYEQRSIDALDSLLGSFYIYVQRKEVMGYHQNNYKNIIQLTRKLLHLAKHDKAGIRKFKKQLAETNPLTERSWLLKQVEKL